MESLVCDPRTLYVGLTAAERQELDRLILHRFPAPCMFCGGKRAFHPPFCDHCYGHGRLHSGARGYIDSCKAFVLSRRGKSK